MSSLPMSLNGFISLSIASCGQGCAVERIIKVKFPEIFLEPAYLVGYAYILTENFGFGKFFSFLDGYDEKNIKRLKINYSRGNLKI